MCPLQAYSQSIHCKVSFHDHYHQGDHRQASGTVMTAPPERCHSGGRNCTMSGVTVACNQSMPGHFDLDKDRVEDLPFLLMLIPKTLFQATFNSLQRWSNSLLFFSCASLSTQFHLRKHQTSKKLQISLSEFTAVCFPYLTKSEW